MLDTEGLESAARGEESNLFDRQLSALATAAADVVLLNLWARDLRGGRAELHRELLERLARAGVESKDGKRRAMIVVLRDSEHPVGDLAAAREAMNRGLDEAYARAGRELPRGPKGLPKIEEELDLSFVALPSLSFQREAFEEGVKELRRGLAGRDSNRKVSDSDIFLSMVMGNDMLKVFPFSSSCIQMGSLTDIARGKRLQPVPLPKFPSLAQELWASITEEGGNIAEALKSLDDKGDDKKKGGEEEEIRSFLRKQVLASCCQEAEKVSLSFCFILDVSCPSLFSLHHPHPQAIERLERKVEIATEMPILEFGRDAEAILSTAIKSMRNRLSQQYRSSRTSSKRKQKKNDMEALLAEDEKEVISTLGRRLEPTFCEHIEALTEFYLNKFEDSFAGLFMPIKKLDKEAKALSADIIGAFEKAAKTAVPLVLVGTWEYDGQWARLKDEIDVEIADRKMEVEVAFPAEEIVDNRFMRPSWWKKVSE